MAAHTHTFDGDIVHLFETRAFASLSISTQRAITGWRVGRRQLVAAGIDGFERKFRCFKPRARGLSVNQVDIVGLELKLDLVDLPTANARRSGSKHAPGGASPSPLAF